MLALYLAAAFFLGSVPNAYLAGRLLKKIDIRQHGSGNAGATNVVRVLGRGPGIAVFLLDFLKGVVPAALFGVFFPQTPRLELMCLVAGLFAVIGHMFTPFLSFKGGKGVATAAGALCAAFPLLFFVSFVSWVVVFSVTKIVSVSSLASVSFVLAAAFLTQPDTMVRVVFFGLFLLVFWSHRANISRLRKGQEHRFGK